ncbi:MAG: PAS domain-containing protein [Planctomycetes bacterium]|nr:PAS domain-containing protein [Planctomycetota bacterium]
MNILKKSLAAQALLGIIVILLPILATFSVCYYQNKAHAIKRSVDDLTIIAEAYEGQVYLFLDMLKRRTEDFASDGLIKTLLRRKTRESRDTLQGISVSKNKHAVDTLRKHLIKNKLPLSKSIKTIVILSMDGRVVVSTNDDEIGMDYSREPFFTTTTTTTTMKNCPGHNGLPELAISTPIYGRDALQGVSPNNNCDKPVGVLVNFVRISNLNEILSGRYLEMQGAFSSCKSDTGKNMEVYLVNSSKLMITASKFVKDAILRQVVNTLPVEAGLTSNKEMTGFYTDYRGTEVLGASMFIPSLRWVLLAEIDKSEVLAPVKRMLFNALIMGAVVVVMLALLFIVFFKKMVRPLHIISGAAKDIACGNFDVAIPVTMRNEIGVLCESFNTMSRDIKIKTNTQLRLTAILDATTDFVATGGMDGKVTYFNPAARRMLGIEKNEDVSDVCFSETHPEWANAVVLEKGIPAALSNGTWHGETAFLARDGREIPVSQVIIAHKDARGTVNYLSTIARDVTELKLFEKKLKKSEEMLRAILDNTTAIVYTKDIQGRYTFINRQFEELFHIKRDEIEGKTPYHCFPKEIADTHLENDRKVFNAKIPMEFDEEATHDDGTLHSYISVKFPLVDSTGNVYAVCGVSTDITERKRIEESLRKSENKYRTLLENLPQRVFYKDRNLVYVSCNESYARDLNIQPGEICGKTDYDFYPEELAVQYRADDKRIMESGQTEDLEGKYVKDGREMIVRTVKTPVKDEGGNVMGILGIFWDITEYKLADRERRELREQLYHIQKLESIGTLAGGIAHDFNNILAIIMSYGGLLEKELENDGMLREYVQNILDAAKKAAALTNGLLAFSRREAIDTKPVHLNEVVKKMGHIIPGLLGKDIQFKTVLTGKNCVVMGNSGHIEQILMNLVVNARDAMPRGGSLVVSTDVVAAETHGNVSLPPNCEGEKYALLSVSDTGIGMDKEMRKRIFEPFFTTKEIGKGTGIGLSIVYGTVKRHRGYIDVISKPGKGTTFKIYLPLIESMVEEVIDNYHN